MGDMNKVDLAHFQASVAEQAERYEEMVEYMKEVVNSKESGQDLDADQRNLLSVAYKNVVGASRASYRILASIRDVEAKKEHAVELKICEDEMAVVSGELENTCNEVIELLKGRLIPNAGADVEAKVFYLKMAGDYHRYIAEFADGPKRDSSKDAAIEMYLQATHAAAKSERPDDYADKDAKDLPPTHPIRLGLALNFSVFYYEIAGEPKKACELAKSAFDDAIAELDQLSEDSYKDATLIMQLLRDNLTLWTSDPSE